MPIATYSLTQKCDPCGPPSSSGPALPTMPIESVTKCPTICTDGSLVGALDLKILPDGQPMVVEYYLQVLEVGDNPASIDLNLNPVFQRLARIDPMTLFVTQPLTNDVDPVTGIVTREGSAIFLGIASPNFGDLFIMPLEDGEDYYFRITQVTPSGGLSKPNYTIDYKLFGKVSDIPGLRLDLANKISDVDDYAFSTDQWLSDGVGLTTQSEDAQIARSEQAAWLSNLLCQWAKYYDPDSATYVTTLNDFRVYDTFVNNFMLTYNSITRQSYSSPQDALDALWHRGTTAYSRARINTVYDLLIGIGCMSDSIAVPNMYQSALISTYLSLPSVRDTTIEYIITGPIANVQGTSLADEPSLPLHQDGYIITNNYFTEVEANMTPIDKVVKAIADNNLTQTTMRNAISHLQTLSVPERYWVIPILYYGLL